MSVAKESEEIVNELVKRHTDFEDNRLRFFKDKTDKESTKEIFYYFFYLYSMELTTIFMNVPTEQNITILDKYVDESAGIITSYVDEYYKIRRFSTEFSQLSFSDAMQYSDKIEKN